MNATRIGEERSGVFSRFITVRENGVEPYLEDVATEFDIQGLELDWAGVCWDADFRYVFDDEKLGDWTHNDFRGTKWQRVCKS